MTPGELRLWAILLRRAAALTPDLAARLLEAFAVIRESITDADLEQAMRLGVADQIVAQLIDDVTSNAFAPAQDALRGGILDAARYYTRELPIAQGGLGIRFDFLNPKVITAIRSLESRVMTDLTADLRAVVRATVEQGLKSGSAPKALAAELRNVIGLGPSQLEQVQHFRDALNGVNGRSVDDYTLRDKRFGVPTTPEQIDKAVAAYRNRRIAQNAETVSRTASLDAMKLGQHLAWQDAIDQGLVDEANLTKRWSGVLDARERAAHVAMEGQTVAFNARFSNGEMIPGDSTYNCRCLAIYRLRLVPRSSVESSQSEPTRSLAAAAA